MTPHASVENVEDPSAGNLTNSTRHDTTLQAPASDRQVMAPQSLLGHLEACCSLEKNQGPLKFPLARRTAYLRRDDARCGAGDTGKRGLGVFLPAACRLGKAVSCHRSPKGGPVWMMRAGVTDQGGLWFEKAMVIGVTHA